MANSNILIQFNAMPIVDNSIQINESKLGINLNEIFKQFRITNGQTAIPLTDLGEYRMTISSIANVLDIDVGFIPNTGIFTKVALSSVAFTDNLNGTVTYSLNSSTEPVLFDNTTQTAILWSEGEFIYFGPVANYYSGFISENYRAALNADYNSGGLFTVEAFDGIAGTGVGVVRITANYANAVFSFTNNSPASITVDNQAIVPDFNISSVIFANASTNQCQIVKVNAVTNVLATKILSPFVANGNTQNPFSFDVIRGQNIYLLVENALGQQASQNIIIPAFLNALNFAININASPNGATVVVVASNSNGLNLQYSLDGSTWQTSNVFNGLLTGNYVLHVKDQLGCSFVKDFEVNEYGIYTPYFYISKSNSIRFANRISWGDAANYKNDENTLGAEVDVQLAYSGCQNFKSANVITTQFKSNYTNNSIKIIREDLSEINVPVLKMTNNIGVKEKRDAIKCNLGNGKTGIYFLSGNIYDYSTNSVIEPYSLNGLLPEWALVGNYINIDNAWFLIEDIIYDEEKQADVLVFSNNYTGINIGIVVGVIYNDFNYEVYEFTIDMVNYLNETIQVKIENTDPRFEHITHLSEKIDVAVNFDKSVEIIYWNDDNTDIFYATGIRHLINCELTKQEGVSEEESEAYKTDTTAILLKSQLYELDKFIFEPVSKEIWRKLMIALSHKNVTINGVQYVKNGNFETEGPLDKSNLYQLKATMLKTGIVYNSDSATGDDFNTGSIEVPGLIQTEIGFVKY